MAFPILSWPLVFVLLSSRIAAAASLRHNHSSGWDPHDGVAQPPVESVRLPYNHSSSSTPPKQLNPSGVRTKGVTVSSEKFIPMAPVSVPMRSIGRPAAPEPLQPEYSMQPQQPFPFAARPLPMYPPLRRQLQKPGRFPKMRWRNPPPSSPAPAPSQPARPQRPVKILAFGDSWAEMGPSWETFEDLFHRKGINVDVKMVARSGTRACQWAGEKENLMEAALQKFGDSGPDYVWYSLGGNDYLSDHYTECSERARTSEAAFDCIKSSSQIVNHCTNTLLNTFWEKFPNTPVFQCGYDLACEEGECFPLIKVPYCGTNKNCLNKMTFDWQTYLLPDRGPLYTGLNILGTVQAANNEEGASPGNPIFDRGSPCNLMETCVHPIAGSIAATAIGEVFWNKYFSKFFLPGPPIDAPPRQVRQHVPVQGGNLEYDLAVCLWDWVPSLRQRNDMPDCKQQWEALTGMGDEDWLGLMA